MEGDENRTLEGLLNWGTYLAMVYDQVYYIILYRYCLKYRLHIETVSLALIEDNL